MKEEVIHLVTVSETSSLHDIPSREGSTVTITKSPVQEKEPMFTKNDSVTSQPEQSDAPPSSSPISSHNETENNLQMVTNSQSTVVVDDSVDAWNSFSAAHLDTRNRLSLWKSGIERLHDTRDNDIHSVGFVSNVMVYAVPMIVSDISSKTKYRDVQSHFFDSNVLSVRYVNKIHCAYITYVNYEEMLKAVFKYNGSVLKGKTIYCRPSFFEEMEKDNELCSKLLLRRSQHSTKKQTAKRISFIPELNGISQYESKNTVKRYTVSLSQYHPQYLSSYDRHQNFRSRYPYYASKTVPIIRLLSTRTYFPSHYVIIKPWLKLDVLASKKYQYWSVSLKKACQLNYLFKNSNKVNLIFSVKGTKSYQGYAVMKSEVLDLKLLTSRDTVGTMFQDTGFQFKTQANGRPWRYAFRVDWKNTKKTGLSSTKDLANPWLNNYCVNLSKDCTVVEPTVGKKIVQIINGQ
ncbi:YT521-B-like domain-containing protein [Helicostylum pulchrum]|nr:YT521-B-like domain-containing protein [Helicostylum pulchrum]